MNRPGGSTVFGRIRVRIIAELFLGGGMEAAKRIELTSISCWIRTYVSLIREYFKY
jgi:hypothetical protein